MKKSEIVNKIHSVIIVYLLCGWIFESQREYLVFLLPSLQYQFLMTSYLYQKFYFLMKVVTLEYLNLKLLGFQ